MHSSRALHHFPGMTWRQGRRMLWNPLQKKALKNRPEERVRLRVIDYLIREANWPPSRIGLEVSASRGHQDQKGRADIICYDRDFTPLLLVECKAENVKLNQHTLAQAGAYNSSISSEYVLVTNGVQDYLYKTSAPEESLSEIPLIWPESASEFSASGFDYWANRGFAGQNTSPALRRFIGLMLEKIFLTETDDATFTEDVAYINPKISSPDGPLDHYYRVLNYDDEWRVALTMVAAKHGSTRLVMMLKKQNENVGLIEINPELHRKKVGPDTIIYSNSRKAPENLFEKISLPLNPKQVHGSRQLVEPVIEYFNQHRIAHA